MKCGVRKTPVVDRAVVAAIVKNAHALDLDRSSIRELILFEVRACELEDRVFHVALARQRERRVESEPVRAERTPPPGERREHLVDDTFDDDEEDSLAPIVTAEMVRLSLAVRTAVDVRPDLPPVDGLGIALYHRYQRLLSSELSVTDLKMGRPVEGASTRFQPVRGPLDHLLEGNGRSSEELPRLGGVTEVGGGAFLAG